MKPVEHKIRRLVIAELLALKIGYSAQFECGVIQRKAMDRFDVSRAGSVIMQGSAYNIVNSSLLKSTV